MFFWKLLSMDVRITITVSTMLMGMLIGGCSGPLAPAPAPLQDHCLEEGPANSAGYARCVANLEAVKQQALADLLEDRPARVWVVDPDADRFKAADYVNSQVPMSYQFVASIPATSLQSLPIKATIRWKYASMGFLPEPVDRVRMDEMERLVIAALEEKGQAKWVCTLTGASQREWIFYASDEQAFKATVEAALANRAPYPIQISALRAPFLNPGKKGAEQSSDTIYFSPAKCVQ